MLVPRARVVSNWLEDFWKSLPNKGNNRVMLISMRTTSPNFYKIGAHSSGSIFDLSVHFPALIPPAAVNQ
jgi:hypothetical protein